MDENDALLALNQHLKQKFQATSSTVWFYNCDNMPLYAIRLPRLRGLIVFEVDEIQEIFIDGGYTQMCYFVDDSIERILDDLGYN